LSKPFPELLKIGPHVMAFPLVHGSGDFAWEIRRAMMQYDFDCIAVPLPESFQPGVEKGILGLPVPTVVVQKSKPVTEYRPDSDADSDVAEFTSYVPVDPCQGVIAALRVAMEERLPRKFIDLETDRYEPHSTTLPDPYALKQLSVEKFAAAVAPFLQPAGFDQWHARINHMAWQLRELSVDYKRILFVTNIVDWPWVREAFGDRELEKPEDEDTFDPELYGVDPDTLYFLMREIPFIANLYEDARRELEDDENLSIDGVKELLITARDRYIDEYGNRARKIAPSLMSRMLKYIRNLTLIGHRLSPQLSDIVVAAKQVAGDGYARIVLETAKQYEFQNPESMLPECRMGIDQIALPEGDVAIAANRLPGPPIHWTTIEIQPKPSDEIRKDWKQRWNPFSQCSWPPEDDLIENFRRTVFDRASEVLGADMAKTEKFTTSVKDGIDIRDTVRNWHTGEIYVKVLPPNRGKLDVAVMLFDSPADPREYPWRTTWFAEHKDESTLAFYATDFQSQPVGPGICLAHYGGAMFIYPPVMIPDIWSDPRLDFASTLEERLISAACLYSTCRHVALLSPAPPGQAWKKIAKHYGKTLVHLPLSKFGDSTVQQLRMVHVLNGKEVRSYASNFIRRV
jgi:hypothetical protein